MSDQTALKIRIVVLCIAIAGLAAALQMAGPAVGLSRDAGLWVWAAGSLLLIALILGPALAKHTGARKALPVGVLTLAAGAGIYLYVTHVMLPDAATRAKAIDPRAPPVK